MEFADLKDFVTTSKDVLELFRGISSALPKGEQRDKAEKSIEAAAILLARSDAKLAKDLGFRLCQCEFPGHPMLWREAENAWVCPNSQCQHKVSNERPRVITGELRLTAARRGRSRE